MLMCFYSKIYVLTTMFQTLFRAKICAACCGFRGLALIFGLQLLLVCVKHLLRWFFAAHFRPSSDKHYACSCVSPPRSASAQILLTKFCRTTLTAAYSHVQI